jgi:hypothetical protein
MPERAERLVADKKYSADVKPHHVLMTTLGIAVGYQLSIPSAPVTNAEDYWLATHGDTAKRLISEVNEQAMVPFDTTYRIAQRVWMTRYRLVHEPQRINVWEFVEEIIEEDKTNFSPIVREIVDGLDDAPDDALHRSQFLILDFLDYFQHRSVEEEG